MEVLGHKAKEVRVSPTSGLTTLKISKDLLFEIEDFYNEVLKKKFNPKEVIRGYRESEKDSSFTFRHGIGYDWKDQDLLGGTASGTLKKVFESYRDYTKDKKEINLKILENSIKNHNELNNKMFNIPIDFVKEQSKDSKEYKER